MINTYHIINILTGSDVDFDSNAINLTYIPNRLIIENIRIPIICDYVKEESQSFDVTIATDSPLVYIDNDKVTVTITDNTGKKFLYVPKLVVKSFM